MEADFTNPLVFQTDFGLVDGAVSAMYGVAYTVHPELKIHDLTHDITPYNIWEASYRLIQTISYWPKDTVFVSVVDPGVGSSRRSVVARTCSGHYNLIAVAPCSDVVYMVQIARLSADAALLGGQASVYVSSMLGYQKMRDMSYQEVLRTNGQISFPEVLRQQNRL